MIQETPQSDLFKQQMGESLRQETLHSSAITIRKNDNVYTCGDRDELVYFIESGQIKLLMLSPDGRECLLAIHSAGDIFGELCLSGLGARLETATAMEFDAHRVKCMTGVTARPAAPLRRRFAGDQPWRLLRYRAGGTPASWRNWREKK